MGYGKTYKTQWLEDLSGNQGTANQVLISTSTGIAWATASGTGIIGGPYLPLSAGSSYPLTGTLYGTSTNFSGNGDYAGSMILGNGASTAEAYLTIGQARTDNGYSYIDLVGDATYTDYGLRIIRNNTGANTTSAILHKGTGNLVISANDSASILLKTNGATALTLNNTQNAIFTGNVGIGTTSPTQAKLVVNTTSLVASAFGRDGTDGDVVQIYNGLAGTTKVIALGASGNDGTIYSQYGDLLLQPTGGNVGIGTVSPSAKLEVSDSSGATLMINTDGGSNADSTLNFVENNVDRASIKWDGVDNDLRLTTEVGDFTMNPSGNVGIGTDTPQHKLEVFEVGNSLSIGNNTNAQTYMSFANTRTMIGYSGANALIQGGSGKGIQFNVNNDTFNSGEAMRIASSGNVGIGTTSPNYKLSVAGGMGAGGKVTYTKSYSSLDTTGNAVAGLTTSTNGQSAGFTFTCFGHTGGYQKLIYSCYNSGGTWIPKKVINEGTNQLDVVASANGTTITFTFKSILGTMSYSPRVTVEAVGTAINSTYA